MVTNAIDPGGYYPGSAPGRAPPGADPYATAPGTPQPPSTGSDQASALPFAGSPYGLAGVAGPSLGFYAQEGGAIDTDDGGGNGQQDDAIDVVRGALGYDPRDITGGTPNIPGILTQPLDDVGGQLQGQPPPDLQAPETQPAVPPAAPAPQAPTPAAQRGFFGNANALGQWGADKLVSAMTGVPYQRWQFNWGQEAGGAVPDGPRGRRNIAPLLDQVQRVLQHGRRKHGVLQPQQPQPQGAIPTGGYLTGGPVVNAFDDGGSLDDDDDTTGAVTPPPAPAVPGGDVMSYLSGADSVPTQQAESQVDPAGTMDPNDRKLAAIVTQPNLDAQWQVLQGFRNKYEHSKQFAAVAADQDNLQAAAHAANLAFQNVPDGQNWQFEPTGTGIRMTVTRPDGVRQYQDFSPQAFTGFLKGPRSMFDAVSVFQPGRQAGTVTPKGSDAAAQYFGGRPGDQDVLTGNVGEGLTDEERERATQRLPAEAIDTDTTGSVDTPAQAWQLPTDETIGEQAANRPPPTINEVIPWDPFKGAPGRSEIDKYFGAQPAAAATAPAVAPPATAPAAGVRPGAYPGALDLTGVQPTSGQAAAAPAEATGAAPTQPRGYSPAAIAAQNQKLGLPAPGTPPADQTPSVAVGPDGQLVYRNATSAAERQTARNAAEAKLRGVDPVDIDDANTLFPGWQTSQGMAAKRAQYLATVRQGKQKQAAELEKTRVGSQWHTESAKIAAAAKSAHDVVIQKIASGHDVNKLQIAAKNAAEHANSAQARGAYAFVNKMAATPGISPEDIPDLYRNATGRSLGDDLKIAGANVPVGQPTQSIPQQQGSGRQLFQIPSGSGRSDVGRFFYEGDDGNAYYADTHQVVRER